MNQKRETISLPPSIGLAIKEAREKAKLQPKDLAVKSGVSADKIRKIESGQSEDIGDLQKIRRALRIPVESLPGIIAPQIENIKDQIAALSTETSNKISAIFGSIETGEQNVIMRIIKETSRAIHDKDEFIFVLDTSDEEVVCITIDNIPIKLSKNNYCVIKKNTPHSYSGNGTILVSVKGDNHDFSHMEDL